MQPSVRRNAEVRHTTYDKENNVTCLFSFLRIPATVVVAGAAILTACPLSVHAAPPRFEDMSTDERRALAQKAKENESLAAKLMSDGKASPPPSNGLCPGGKSAIEPNPVAVESVRFQLNIVFASNSSKIDASQQAVVARLAELLQQAGKTRFRIEGHTDSRGSPAANLVLSWQRALAMYMELVEKHGIEPSRLELRGWGHLRPYGTDHADNRRIEMVQIF